MQKVGLLFLLLSLSSFSWSQNMRVLFIGNSFTHYNNMPKIFQDLADSKAIKVDVHMSAKSNHTFQMHSERHDLFEDIHREKWDYVVLQGFSRELAYDEHTIDSTVVPFVRQITDSIYSKNPCATILLYETWGYAYGYPEDSLNVNFQKMNDNIHQGYLYLSNLFDFPIVPVGKVWETVKENNPSIDLYQEDLKHPSKFGSYLAACSFYAAIFKQNPNSGFTDGLNFDKAKYIQNIAFNVVDQNLTRYFLNRNIVSVKTSNEKGRLKVDCHANFPKAKSIVWNFGDGKTANSFDTQHYYSKSGTYIITVTIQDACGERVLKKKAVFN
ncbi:MAG: DUF4886 domain-containing protein [Crocinitomicaceae bacterium]